MVKMKSKSGKVSLSKSTERTDSKSESSQKKEESKKRRGAPKKYGDRPSVRIYPSTEVWNWLNEKANAEDKKLVTVAQEIVDIAFKRDEKMGGATQLQRMAAYFAKGRVPGLENLGLGIEKFLAHEAKQEKRLLLEEE